VLYKFINYLKSYSTLTKWGLDLFGTLTWPTGLTIKLWQLLISPFKKYIQKQLKEKQILGCIRDSTTNKITSDWNQRESNGLLIIAPKSTHHQLVFWDQCTSTSIWQSNGQVCFYLNHYFFRHRETHTNDNVDWVYFSLEKKFKTYSNSCFHWS